MPFKFNVPQKLFLNMWKTNTHQPTPLDTQSKLSCFKNRSENGMLFNLSPPPLDFGSFRVVRSQSYNYGFIVLMGTYATNTVCVAGIVKIPWKVSSYCLVLYTKYYHCSTDLQSKIQVKTLNFFVHRLTNWKKNYSEEKVGHITPQYFLCRFIMSDQAVDDGTADTVGEMSDQAADSGTADTVGDMSH